jgi:hypothetical protein
MPGPLLMPPGSWLTPAKYDWLGMYAFGAKRTLSPASDPKRTSADLARPKLLLR